MLESKLTIKIKFVIDYLYACSTESPSGAKVASFDPDVFENEKPVVDVSPNFVEEDESTCVDDESTDTIPEDRNNDNNAAEAELSMKAANDKVALTSSAAASNATTSPNAVASANSSSLITMDLDSVVDSVLGMTSPRHRLGSSFNSSSDVEMNDYVDVIEVWIKSVI